MVKQIFQIVTHFFYILCKYKVLPCRYVKNNLYYHAKAALAKAMVEGMLAVFPSREQLG